MMESNTQSILDQIDRLVNLEGDPCDFGCNEADVDAMIARAKELFPNKPYCIVTSWCWADISSDQAFMGAVRELGSEPCFIYADCVLADEIGRIAKGSFVKTSLLVSFHHNCIFSTRNTLYILVGSGTRMTVSREAFSQLIL